jgi:GDP/UDP-N,N'-diacetylbacillosamine 2-epimerase (hydrolysing)
MTTVAVITGSRAEYGLLRGVMEGIRASDRLELQVIVTGMHLSPEFGDTWRLLERDGFHIDRRVESLLSSDSAVGVAKSIGLGTIGFADALDTLRPDLILLLGDRFELLAAASAALVMRIPIAHVHGGETTEGAFDESIRHSLTKMSHLHFVAAAPYRDRVVQLGEDPNSVFNVGGLGIDAARSTPLLSRPELEDALGISLGARNLLVTFHPVTLDERSSADQMAELLAALHTLHDTTIVFTLANADPEGRALNAQIQEFVVTHPLSHAFGTLGATRYFSCLRHMDGVVGNSSSGLLEAPFFRTGTVNIGDRQAGRLKAASVIDCQPERAQILAAIAELRSPEFQYRLDGLSPYGAGGASELIVKRLEAVDPQRLVRKRFHDQPGIFPDGAGSKNE